MMVLVRCHLKVIQTIIQFMFELTLPVCSNFERSLEVKSRAVFTVFFNLPVRSGCPLFSDKAVCYSMGARNTDGYLHFDGG
jgi:hypothetical protein